MTRVLGTALCVVAFLWSAAPAHAYIDPAAGSLLLQVVIGGVAGLLLTLKLFWHRLAHFLSPKKGEAEEPEE